MPIGGDSLAPRGVAKRLEIGNDLDPSLEGSPLLGDDRARGASHGDVMTRNFDPDGPAIGVDVEMIRPFADRGSFEPAQVVDRFHDPIFGGVLELEFDDKVRMQRVWPSPMLRG